MDIIQHVNAFPVNIDDIVGENLQQLCICAQNTQYLLSADSPCEDVLGEFTKIKHIVEHTESLLLSSHLKKCFLAEIPFMKDLYLALQNLSLRGHGALIAVERSDDLKHVIEQRHFGVLLDAKITPQLLQSIFTPDTPLHDGAVIIKNERIFSAGTLLPLSKKIIKSKQLGTRHRAALGLSEICDAIVFVVSEETRNVSIAFKGDFFILNRPVLKIMH